MITKIVVSDTTAITHLAKIGALNILHQLYPVIYIPEAVYSELTSGGSRVPGAYEAESFPWIKILQVKNKAGVKLLVKTLDQGESEAIALAKEIKADLLIIDEKLGREEAESMGIKIVGIVGILLLAKKKHIITKVKPYLEHLRCSGFRMNQQLYDTALNLANEKTIDKEA